MPISTVSSTICRSEKCARNPSNTASGTTISRGHGVRVGERGALARVEEIAALPVGQRLAFLDGKPFRNRELRHVLLHHVFGAIEVGNADDGDLAQPAVKLGLEARRRDHIEPRLGQRRGMQQKLVDIDQRTAPAGADLADQLGELGVGFLFDIGNAGHGCFAVVRGDPHRSLD